ncbi:hypothetical protein SASPL_106558 [Salvia splendens]|uniref:Proteinase inhibitor I13 n=1 Tax=Salvia splendens TaxID=180675 RepID=A0A8X8YN25_SALSN|nr:hypothetical protein SASPL_106558 [Salvia splendens]
MKNGEEAVVVIESENKFVKATIIKDGTPIPLDFRCDRVWVVVNECGNVIRIPYGRKKGEHAAEVIESENKYVKALIILEGTPTTKEINCNRVRVWVDACGYVVTAPYVG